MRFIKNNIWTICLLVVFGTLAFIGDASAADVSGTSVMSTARSKAVNVFTSVKKIIFVVGGFGLVGIAFAAIFGKVNWKWFASLAVGLAILAAAGSVVDYATGDQTDSLASNGAFGDSFGSAATTTGK